MIYINNVTKKYKGTTILNNVSINWDKNKIHGLIGHNGSGKTVLLKCVCGIMPYDVGEIKVNGKIVGKDIDIPPNIGAIIETPGFLSNYSAYKNLLFLAKINNIIGPREIIQAIQSVGLDPNDKKHVGKYSLGMRQRLGLAQAIMENPDLLILDEPMNGLDKEGVRDMRSYLLELKEKGKTIIIASHSAEDIEILCDTVCEMDKGVLNVVR